MTTSGNTQGYQQSPVSYTHLDVYKRQAYNDMCEIYPETEVPLYVIGSEVPIPGGAREHELSLIHISSSFHSGNQSDE